MDKLEIKKFIWAYMVETGRITTGEWSYYGGDFELTPALSNLGWMGGKYDLAMKKFLDDVKLIGIDWDKTSDPVSSHESSFEGTFSPPSEVETLLGTLALKDGSEFLIGVGNSQTRFSEYSTLLASLAEDKQRVKDILGEA